MRDLCFFSVSPLPYNGKVRMEAEKLFTSIVFKGQPHSW